jgi:hypothetical protein
MHRHQHHMRTKVTKVVIGLKRPRVQLGSLKTPGLMLVSCNLHRSAKRMQEHTIRLHTQHMFCFRQYNMAIKCHRLQCMHKYCNRNLMSSLAVSTMTTRLMPRLFKRMFSKHVCTTTNSNAWPQH